MQKIPGSAGWQSAFENYLPGLNLRKNTMIKLVNLSNIIRLSNNIYIDEESLVSEDVNIYLSHEMENNRVFFIGKKDDQGEKQGKWEIYKKGELTGFCTYKDDKRHGPSIGLFPDTGKLEDVTIYENGKCIEDALGRKIALMELADMVSEILGFRKTRTVEERTQDQIKKLTRSYNLS